MNYIRRWILNKSKTSTEEVLAYWIAAILFTFSVVLLKPSHYYGVELSQILAYIAIGFLIYGFWTYLSPMLKKSSDSLIIKALWAGITITGATISFSCAQIIVNETLKVPSSAFPHTQTLVALFLAPVVIGIFVLALGLVLIPVFQVMLYSETGEFSIKSILNPRNGRPKKEWTEVKYFVRFVAFVMTLVICVAGLTRNDIYLNGIGDFVRWFSFHFETENYSNCAVESGAKVGYLGGDQVISALKYEDSYEFKIVDCKNKTKN